MGLYVARVEEAGWRQKAEMRVVAGGGGCSCKYREKKGLRNRRALKRAGSATGGRKGGRVPLVTYWAVCVSFFFFASEGRAVCGEK